ncbi:MAG: imelysin family protein [Cellvibrionaceae bacterium]
MPMPSHLKGVILASLQRSLFACAFILLLACEPQEQPKNVVPLEVEETLTSPTLLISNEQAEILANNIWQQGLAALEGNQAQAEKLNDAIGVLLENPNQKSLMAARKQWHLSFLEYQKLAPFLSIQADVADISSNNALNKLSEWRSVLAAWPLQPGYLDSYDVYLHSGIVNDISLPITVSHLRKQHGLTDSEEVTLGLHAIEFMLWANKSKTAAERFVKKTKVPLALAQSGLKQNELPNNRRRALLALQAQLFQRDLTTLVSYWQPNGLFASAFQQLKPLEKIVAIHNGLQLSINTLHELLLNNGNKDNADALHLNAFAGKRQQAIIEALSVIQELYFSTDKSLMSAFFPDDKQQQFIALLADIKKQINNEKNTNYTLAMNALNQVMSLLSLHAIGAEQNG